MNESKRDVIIWIIVPIVVVVAFLVWLIFPTGKYYPGAYSPSQTITATPTPEPLKSAPTIALTRQTVQAVIASITRTESYARTYTVATYWQDGEFIELIELVSESSTLEINGKLYSKTDYPRAGLDTLARIPTYEEILTLPVENIISAEYLRYKEHEYAKVQFTGLLYKHVYYVSLTTGLLDYAYKYDGDTLVYSMELVS